MEDTAIPQNLAKPILKAAIIVLFLAVRIFTVFKWVLIEGPTMNPYNMYVVFIYFNFSLAVVICITSIYAIVGSRIATLTLFGIMVLTSWYGFMIFIVGIFVIFFADETNWEQFIYFLPHTIIFFASFSLLYTQTTVSDLPVAKYCRSKLYKNRNTIYYQLTHEENTMRGKMYEKAAYLLIFLIFMLCMKIQFYQYASQLQELHEIFIYTMLVNIILFTAQIVISFFALRGNKACSIIMAVFLFLSGAPAFLSAASVPFISEMQQMETPLLLPVSVGFSLLFIVGGLRLIMLRNVGWSRKSDSRSVPTESEILVKD